MKTQDDYDAELTAEEWDGRWAIVDTCGQFFWPTEDAETQAAAWDALYAGAGSWSC